MMWISASASISVLMMASTMSRIEDLVEGTSAEEFSEDLFWIAENEREAAEDEIVLERIVSVSSALMIAVVRFIVS